MHVRPTVTVRSAVPADAEALVDLWDAAVKAGADPEGAIAAVLWHRPSLEDATATLTEYLGKPEHHLLVAEHDGAVVGGVVFNVTTMTPLQPGRVLVVTDLQVAVEYRRRGVAWAMLAAVSDHGEERGCEIVMACIPTQAREPARYLTKVGFSQVAVLRAAQAGKLRARLDTRSAAARDTGRMIAARRGLRRRTAPRDAG